MDFEEKDMECIEELLHLIQQRDAAIIRYITAQRELDRHRGAAAKYESQIDDLISTLPPQAALQAEKRAEKEKPWE